ncbi:DMT family transporter [Shinella sp. CPCC 101442]|uniref:DMT family transporter n=1 Tax=Shinella sp. CPCC 101442 TaxID=2932265 RepID=UPI002152732E|nr:DMT family transporter [Shinella sp. CPCC 101442]MCR6499532.1 DMT family transporter [Shinella sp. CPCC 101442]
MNATANATDSSGGSTMQGVALMAVAMLLLPCMDAIAKYMANFAGMSPGQVTFYRFFFQILCTVPLIFTAGGSEMLRPKRPWMNLLRGAIHGAASLLFFAAVKYMPLADVFAIYFVEPFILTAMSAVFLGERVGWRRWLAIMVGFGGALIVIQPSFILFGWTALLPVGCAFLYSIYLFMNRALGDADSPLTMQTIAGFGGTVLMGAALLIGDSAGLADFAPSLPDTTFHLALLVILGALSGYAHMLVVRAFRMAPLSLLAPFQYFEIISATVLGYAIFGDFPTPSKWLGIAVIVASGLFIIWREHKSRKLTANAAFD